MASCAIEVKKTDRGWTVFKGDLKASFGSKKNAQQFAKKEMPHLWMKPFGGTWDDRNPHPGQNVSVKKCKGLI